MTVLLLNQRSISLSPQCIQDLLFLTEWLPGMSSCFRNAYLEMQTTHNTNNSNGINYWLSSIPFSCFSASSSKSILSDSEKSLISRFCNALEEFVASVENLHKVGSSPLDGRTFSVVNGAVVANGSNTGSNRSGHKSREEMLFLCASRCLKASEALKSEAISAKPVRPDLII